MTKNDIEGEWKEASGRQARELCPESLSDTELLAVIIGTGIPS